MTGQERGKNLIDHIRSEPSAAHLQPEAGAVITTGGKRRFRKAFGITPVIQPPLPLQAEYRRINILSGHFPRRQLFSYPGSGIITPGQQP